MMRCAHCGFNNPITTSTCGCCGAPLPVEQAITPHLWSAPAESIGRRDAMSIQPISCPSTSQQHPPPTSRPPALTHFHLRRRSLERPDLEGTVIATDAIYYEPPDIDLARAINRVLLLVEFLGLPSLLLWVLVNTIGPVSVIGGVLALYLFFKFVSPVNLFSALGIFHFLNPMRRSRDEQVPVQYLRIRDRQEQEHIVRRKGRLRRGHVMPGDEVALWGHWRSGTLDLRHGMNLRTGATIAVYQSYSWAFLVLNLLIFGFLIGIFAEPLANLLSP